MQSYQEDGKNYGFNANGLNNRATEYYTDGTFNRGGDSSPNVSLS